MIKVVGCYAEYERDRRLVPYVGHSYRLAGAFYEE